MRYVENGRYGSVWGRRVASPHVNVAAIASRTTPEPTVILSINVFDEDTPHDYDIIEMVGSASIDLTPEQVRRFAERLLRSADEAEERSRRFRYAREVKEVLS